MIRRDRLMTGHISIGPITVYGRNAMHWGVTIRSKRFGYICFRLPFLCFGKWWRLYFYLSPNATPWASTFMIGKRYDMLAWSLSRVRLRHFGHNFDTDKHRDELHRMNTWEGLPPKPSQSEGGADKNATKSQQVSAKLSMECDK